MKKVIIIRHGYYNEIKDYPLSDFGKEQMKNLAIRLLPEIEDKNMVFVCSMARRATESAEILQEIWKKKGIDLPLNKYYELWSGADSYREKNRLKEEENKKISIQDFDWFENFIKESTCEVIIAVTHLEFIEEFPVVLAWEFGNGDISLPQKGGARILNLITKEQKIIHN